MSQQEKEILKEPIKKEDVEKLVKTLDEDILKLVSLKNKYSSLVTLLTTSG